MKARLICIFGSTLLFSCIFSERSAERIFAKSGFRVKENWRDFKLSDNLRSDAKEILTFRKSNGEVVRVVFFKELDRSQALKAAQARSFAIKSLFYSKDVPYFGRLSKTESCLSLNEVTAHIDGIEDGFILVFRLMATKLFVYGSCSEADDFYTSKYLIKYCENKKTLIEARFFTPKDSVFSIKPEEIECEI